MVRVYLYTKLFPYSCVKCPFPLFVNISPISSFTTRFLHFLATQLNTDNRHRSQLFPSKIKLLHTCMSMPQSRRTIKNLPSFRFSRLLGDISGGYSPCTFYLPAPVLVSLPKRHFFRKSEYELKKVELYLSLRSNLQGAFRRIIFYLKHKTEVFGRFAKVFFFGFQNEWRWNLISYWNR